MSSTNLPGSAPRPQHRAAVVICDSSGGFRFEVQTLPRPDPGPSEVLVRLSMTGICGSDFSLAAGIHGPTCSILGHEGVGRVEKLGSAVKGIALGQRVGVAWQRDICGLCSFCLVDGGETRCAENITSGRTVDGTFAEYTIVPARYLMPIAEGLSASQIAPILCGGVTIYKALLISGVRAGQWVGISGAGGGVGALGIQYAKAMGLPVLALDAGEEKRALCLNAGADLYIDVMGERGALEGVLEATAQKGVDAVLVTAGAGQAYQDALTMLAPFGTLVCIGIPPPTGTATFHPLDFISKGYRIIGSAVGTRGDILDAIGFVARGQVTPVVTVRDLADLPQIAEDFKRGKLIGKVVLQLSKDLKNSKL